MSEAAIYYAVYLLHRFDSSFTAGMGGVDLPITLAEEPYHYLPVYETYEKALEAASGDAGLVATISAPHKLEASR